MKYQITAHRLWDVSQQGLWLTGLYSLEESVMVAENNLSWSGRIQWSHLSYTYAATLANTMLSLNTAWVVMHSPFLREIADGVYTTVS